jgi:hypothetical protein
MLQKKKELEILGYEKVKLNRTKHEEEHETPLAEAPSEQVRLEYVQADRSTERIGAQARVRNVMRQHVMYAEKTAGGWRNASVCLTALLRERPGEMLKPTSKRLLRVIWRA